MSCAEIVASTTTANHRTFWSGAFAYTRDLVFELVTRQAAEFRGTSRAKFIYTAFKGKKGEAEDQDDIVVFKDTKFFMGVNLTGAKFAEHMTIEFKDSDFGGRSIGFDTIDLTNARDLETTDGLVDPKDLAKRIWSHEKDMLLALNSTHKKRAFWWKIDIRDYKLADLGPFNRYLLASYVRPLLWPMLERELHCAGLRLFALVEWSGRQSRHRCHT